MIFVAVFFAYAPRADEIATSLPSFLKNKPRRRFFAAGFRIPNLPLPIILKHVEDFTLVSSVRKSIFFSLSRAARPHAFFVRRFQSWGWRSPYIFPFSAFRARPGSIPPWKFFKRLLFAFPNFGDSPTLYSREVLIRLELETTTRLFFVFFFLLDSLVADA